MSHGKALYKPTDTLLYFSNWPWGETSFLGVSTFKGLGNGSPPVGCRGNAPVRALGTKPFVNECIKFQWSRNENVLKVNVVIIVVRQNLWGN